MSKGRLLLADDSVTIQKVVNLTFADEGIDVVTVGDGDAAVEKIAESRPDIVLADVHMPGLTGYEVCEHIRANPETRDTPVILLVGSFEPFDEGEAARVGANAYLTKPFQSIRQLVAQVSELIESNAGYAAAAPASAPETENPPVTESYAGEESLSFAAAAEPAGIPLSPPATYVPQALVQDAPERIADIEDLEAASYQGIPESGEGTEGNDIQALYEQSLSDVGSDDDIIETSFGVQSDQAGPEQPPPASDFVESQDHRTEEMHFSPDEFPHEAAETPGHASNFAFDPIGYASNVGNVPEAVPEEPVHGELDNAPFFTGTETPTATLTHPENVPQFGDAPAMPESAPYREPPRRVGEETIPMASRFDRSLSQPFKFDDLDLLDLPGSEASPLEITSPPDANERGANQQLVTLSPELIEMIAQRVVEKLSAKY